MQETTRNTRAGRVYLDGFARLARTERKMNIGTPRVERGRQRRFFNGSTRSQTQRAGDRGVEPRPPTREWEGCRPRDGGPQA